MDTPGHILKTERESQGKSLQEISGNLKLSTVYLTAIEDDDYSLLPAEIFTRAYLRLYAEELRLDGDYILDLFHDLGKDDNEDETVMTEKEPEHVSAITGASAFQLVQASLHKVKCSIKTVSASLKKQISTCNLKPGISEKSKPTSGMDFTFIQRAEPLKTARKYLLPAVTTAAALGVILVSNSDKLFPKKPHAADKQFAAVKSTEEVKEFAAVKSTEEDKQFAAVKATEEDNKEEMPSENMAGTSVMDPKQVEEQISEKLVMKIIAEELTWVSVGIDNGAYKESLLRKGESVTVMAEEQFNLKIGNAGGTKLVLNGRELGELGPHGKVVNITLP